MQCGLVLKQKMNTFFLFEVVIIISWRWGVFFKNFYKPVRIPSKSINPDAKPIVKLFKFARNTTTMFW